MSKLTFSARQRSIVAGRRTVEVAKDSCRRHLLGQRAVLLKGRTLFSGSRYGRILQQPQYRRCAPERLVGLKGRRHQGDRLVLELRILCGPVEDAPREGGHRIDEQSGRARVGVPFAIAVVGDFPPRAGMTRPRNGSTGKPRLSTRFAKRAPAMAPKRLR